MTNEFVAKNLQAFLGDALLHIEEPHGLLTIVVHRSRITDVLKHLKNSEPNFIFLTDITGVHYPNYPQNELCAVYHLHNLEKNIRIRVKAFMPMEDPTIDTATTVFRTANWMERETFDFFGIVFKGHPNLVRILNIDEMDYFPMRKEYPLEDGTRTDKDDSMFGR